MNVNWFDFFVAELAILVLFKVMICMCKNVYIILQRNTEVNVRTKFVHTVFMTGESLWIEFSLRNNE